MTIQAGGSKAVNHHRDFKDPTNNQLEALSRYAEDTSIPAPVREGIQHYLANGKFTFGIASDTIGLIKAFIAAEMGGGDPVTEPGLYVHEGNGAFYLVKRSQIGRLYAMDLVINDAGERNEDGTWRIKPRFEWVYQNGHSRVKQLQAGWKATQEQIKQWGDIWGHCLKCHAELTVQKSIDQGMGDTCYKKQFGK